MEWQPKGDIQQHAKEVLWSLACLIIWLMNHLTIWMVISTNLVDATNLAEGESAFDDKIRITMDYHRLANKK